MTDEELKQDRAIIDAATPGEWHKQYWLGQERAEVFAVGPDGTSQSVAVTDRVDDARFVCAAHARWPAAIAEIERLRARQQELLASMVKLTREVPYEEEKNSTAVLIAEVGTLRGQVAKLRAELAAMQPVVDAAVAYGMSPGGCHRSEARLVDAAGTYHANRRIAEDADPNDTGRHREPDWDAKDAAGAKDGGGPA